MNSSINLNRRSFCRSMAGSIATAAAFHHLKGFAQEGSKPVVMTVTGSIPASQMGLALPHEHVTTDFMGAEKAPVPRYDRDTAVKIILPHLKALKERGVSTLFECTPAYIGRDVVLLKQLSEESGVHIVTNTGYYGAVNNKFIPEHAYEESVDQLASRWLKEWENGIEGTGIRPGFIKLGTGSGPLPPLHEKLVRAAAEVHRQSGLTIGIHTGNGEAAMDEMRILKEEGIAPEAHVWIHAQNDAGPTQIEFAKRGGWVSLDGYSLATPNTLRYPKMLQALKDAGCLNRVLLSHDDGWAVQGEAHSGAGLELFGNGNTAPYSGIFERLVPDLRESGFTQNEIDQLMIQNPANAFGIQKRLL